MHLARIWLLCALLVTSPALASSDLSIYRIQESVDFPVIGVTALGTLIPYALSDHLITRRCPCDSSEVNALDRHVIGNHNVFLDGVSDVTAALALAVPPIADWIDLGATRALYEDLVVYSESVSVNSALVTLAKYTVQRPLPRVYAGQDPGLADSPGGYRSFYSGHTSLTFAALGTASMTLGYRYHTGAWPWIATTAAGLSVAAERVAAGRHFYTDVAVGAVVGTLVGTINPILHHRENGSLGTIGAVPVEGGILVGWSRRW